jgi:flagellar basal body-associated protein FliL
MKRKINLVFLILLSLVLILGGCAGGTVTTANTTAAQTSATTAASTTIATTKTEAPKFSLPYTGPGDSLQSHVSADSC